MALLLALPIPAAKWTKDVLTHSLTGPSDAFLRKLELEIENMSHSIEEAELERIPQEGMGTWRTKASGKPQF